MFIQRVQSQIENSSLVKGIKQEDGKACTIIQIEEVFQN